MANMDNLTPWEPGQSGNLSGKPKGTLNRATILKRYLSAQLNDAPSEIPFELEGRITVEDAIILALIKKALAGDISAIKEIQDTLHGKMNDNSAVSVTYQQMGQIIIDGKPLEFDGGEPVPKHLA